MNTLIAAAVIAAAPIYNAYVGTKLVYTSETKPKVVHKIENAPDGKRNQVLFTLVDNNKEVYGPVTNRIIHVRGPRAKKPVAVKK